ncbi:hypothetical protein A2716_01865 [candidate division WWE3 bacterium RIFCSPHIGHO2_01_FULL_40_23]|uniref:Uncharacterized protein n=1 Tax=candidate division WWE3 bacterium RIFCSPLOWO2_01_FULL_41_18 TaxID=1802625 RepID=A0A1F4VER7_UNCKA|nr:MAG: hypothetical protein A2716_01865 [candidate division WWE3 bacterium RIFCSPHIGHO2_01_FULL_40_23]OGC55736.1 MAG: hypothetical protein A3A78_01715 [candidate division WWE3 bacterium RIFCSPLOWO2_01_FULL_41_18]
MPIKPDRKEMWYFLKSGEWHIANPFFEGSGRIAAEKGSTLMVLKMEELTTNIKVLRNGQWVDGSLSDIPPGTKLPWEK